MRKRLKSFVPNWILDRLAKLIYAPSSGLSNMPTQEVFTKAFEQNTWGSSETRSGQGSNSLLTKGAIDGLCQFIKTEKITSVLDLPCGEFGWMKKVLDQNINYVGGDIVQELVEQNQQHANERISFRHLDILKDELPDADVLLVRDCFVHFSYSDVKLAVENIKRSKFKFLATTHFSKLTVNRDIVTGDWRPINLCLKPFRFTQPHHLITETVEPGYEKEFRGKSLGIWRISDLP